MPAVRVAGGVLSDVASARRQRVRAPALSEADRRLEAERLMARVRCAAAGLYILVGVVKPGDSVALTFLLGGVLVTSAALGMLVGRDRTVPLGTLGVLFACLDTTIFFAILANNLDDPSDAVYIAGLLPVLEGALRWARPGGLAIGAAVGAATAFWTLAVSWQASERAVPEAMTVRAGAMVLVGWAVGSIVRSLQTQQLALQHALDASHDAMVTVDAEGRISSANDPCGPLLGHQPDSLIGARVSDVLLSEGADPAARALLGALTVPLLTEVHTTRPDGTLGWLEVQVTPVERLGIAFVVFRDVTARRETAARLDYAANHDPLTDLPNRRMLIDLIEAAVAAPGGEPALLFVDLDGFKEVNDRMGHDAGDELLREAAASMQQCVRVGDVVTRLAGDEFCVLLGPADAAAVAQVAERIVTGLGIPFVIFGESVAVTASVGAVTHRPGESGDDLLRRADRTMYEAKRAGGNRAQVAAQAGRPSTWGAR